jgi:hypothetical protein
MAPFLIAGVLASLAGLLVFLVIHHFWILPIWFILPPDLVIAALGGLAVGWSYHEIRIGLPPRPWTAPSIILLIAIILAPSIILTQLRPPLINVVTLAIPPGEGPRVALLFLLELVLTSMIIGATAGWFFGRTPMAALSTAIAGVAFALGPGHNIPLLGNTLGVGKGLVLLAAIVLVSAFVLVESVFYLSRS